MLGPNPYHVPAEIVEHIMAVSPQPILKNSIQTPLAATQAGVLFLSGYAALVILYMHVYTFACYKDAMFHLPPAEESIAQIVHCTNA